MLCYWKVFLLLMWGTELSTERKLVYKKDMSEHCRRRVIPSVFLGRQVMEANSEILQFSRIELPYSCFISVRTESGNNIILVVEVKSRQNLEQACSENGNQLVVYEIGDTFGGYWGPLPDQVIYQNPQNTVDYYTLKTTLSQQSTTTYASTADETQNTENGTNDAPVAKDEDERINDKEGDYISVELPIVNVSAKLVPGRNPYRPVFDIDDSFDLFYDVTPGKRIEYDTTVLPLLQFSMDTIVNEKRRGSGVEYSPNFGIEFNDFVTPESRLNFPQLDFFTTTKRTRSHGYKYNVNRRFNFKKDKHFIAAKDSPVHKKQQSSNRRIQYSIQPYYTFTRRYDLLPQPTPKTVEQITNSWHVIDDILKKLSQTTHNPSRHKLGGSGLEHNFTDYLIQNVTMQSILPTSTHPMTTARYTIGSITWRPPSDIYRNNFVDEVRDIKNGSFGKSNKTTEDLRLAGKTVATKSYTENSTIIKLNATDTNKEPEIANNETRLSTKSWIAQTGSLVGHESWDNVVQSAPVMAVILNQTIPQVNGTDGNRSFFNTISLDADSRSANKNKKNVSRRKRYIYGIPIENVRPQHVPTKKPQFSTASNVYMISDVQELAELIELLDDEVSHSYTGRRDHLMIHGRLALRYMRQYVGPAIFNICDHNETVRTIHLFNSSRIVLAINNFTMQSMTVVMTPAQTLSGEARCKGANLECQVGGARVCIDSLNTCNGIPNCGSYDVYDEDRLRCGASAGFQHNVCLAAFTFLAVLVTGLYIVHYWLKRCVPKVSDAFFIYSDTAENILYLNTIMRAPYDADDSGRSLYRTRVFQEDAEYNDLDQPKSSYNYFMRMLNRFLIFCHCKREKKSVTRDEILGDMYKIDAPRFNSFAEIEMSKMLRKKYSDAAVQTGSSLEMKVRSTPTIQEFDPKFIFLDENPPGPSHEAFNINDLGSSVQESESQKTFDELSMLKFFRNARSNSISSNDSRKYKVSSPPQKIQRIPEEKELECIELESDLSLLNRIHYADASTSDIQVNMTGHVQKHLRFDEETHTIPEADTDGDSVGKNEDVSQGSITKARRDQDVNEESDGGSREYKSYFWGGSKRKASKSIAKKKSKKQKSHLALR